MAEFRLRGQISEFCVVHALMADPLAHHPWGLPPWKIDFHPPNAALPESVDVAVVGGGFSGLTTAAWLRRISPETSVALFEASQIGAGASGRTGGLALAESAAGDLSGLGDVLTGVSDVLDTLEVQCALELSGAWEIARGESADQAVATRRLKSPIEWNDSGALRVVNEVPGGTVDPGKLVSGLARAGHRLGAHIFERQPVQAVEWRPSPVLKLTGGSVRAGKVVVATSALSLNLSGIDGAAQPRLTLAVATRPMSEEDLTAAGLGDRKAFYTADLPYLWGRLCSDNAIVFGAGLMSPPASGDLWELNVASSEAAQMFASLERRVRGLHSVFASTSFTHRWGGPISFREEWSPVFSRHPKSNDGIVLGAYAGHGVALSVHLGAWAAEAVLGRRALPDWGQLDT